MRQTLITIMVSTSCLILITLLSLLCIYDRAGKSFYKLKLLEFDYRKHPHKIDESLRLFRHRKTFYYYNKHWLLRLKCLFCLVKEDKVKANLANIAETLSSFFYKYDVVPSDILAGLLLLREEQKKKRLLNMVS
jgi:sn1-specific diacylglycerol lipase